MENPLSEEQIKKLNEILKLEPNKQKEELSEFLSTLNEEQIEFLKKQQEHGKECLFCSLSKGNISSYKVYDDEYFLAVLDINPASKGHILVFSKKHYEFLGQMNEKEIAALFVIVNSLSSQCITKLKAKGVNVYVANGYGAGQAVPHISVNIIPRYDNDKIEFGWETKRVKKEELEGIAKEIKIDKRKEETREEKRKIERIEKVLERIP